MATGTVKFFNAAKGFGFISPKEGGADVFVHISAVERSGLASLNEGDEVVFDLEQDRRSGKAAAVNLEVTGAAPATPSRRKGPSRDFEREERTVSPRSARSPAGTGSGVVKWFNSQKGFGFIQPSDGGADVFVHISAVEQAGLRALNEGQSVAYEVEADRRTGKLGAVNLRLD